MKNISPVNDGLSVDLDVIDRLESNVRSYSRAFPAVFKSAVNAHIIDSDGRQYIDFFAGAGVLNYGHNNPRVKAALINHLQSDGLMHGLDMATDVKIEFLEKFESLILNPRKLDYKVQFTGPTGANAVEAAIKLAKKARKRSHIIGFTNAYHGHSLGALALTGNQHFHDDHYGARSNVSILPYDNYFGDGANTAIQLKQLLTDKSSGIPVPAAIILETVQAEGGVNVASEQWLRDIRSLCDEFDIVLIIDDIQTGNGRTGQFFSFEASGVVPDMVCVSKSIGGGLPLSLLLIKPSLDVWKPAQHTGTFRGNQLAFVAASELLTYWAEPEFLNSLQSNCAAVQSGLERLARQCPGASVRGRGMMQGLDVGDGGLACEITRRCFRNGLIVETAGARDQVLKFLAPLTIDAQTLSEGFDRLEMSMREALVDIKHEAELRSISL